MLLVTAYFYKAILHEACAAETQIYFSSDCIEFLKAYCRKERAAFQLLFILFNSNLFHHQNRNLRHTNLRNLLRPSHSLPSHNHHHNRNRSHHNNNRQKH